MRRAAAVVVVLLVSSVAWAGAGPSAAGSASGPAPAARTVTFPGGGVKVHPGETGKLKKTSPAFRKYVKKKLKTFKKPSRCGAKAVVRVKRWTSDGFAQVKECEHGLKRLYVQVGGAWQDPANLVFPTKTTWCWSLRWYGVPEEFAGRSCVSENEQTVAYPGYQLAADYGTPAFAARTLVGIATRRLYESGVAYLWGAQDDGSTELPVLNTMYEMVADGATLSLTRCFDRSDPELGSRLAEGEQGCVLDAFYGNYRAIYLMHLTPYEEGHWWTSRLTALASS